MSAELSDRINEALNLAQRANSRVDGHEELCAERYSNILTNVNKIESILKWSGSLVVTILLSVLGWLIVAQVEANDSEKEALKDQIEVLQNVVHP